MNEVKDDTEMLLHWQSVGGGALPFNARAKKTRTSESSTCIKKIAKNCNKNSPQCTSLELFIQKLYEKIVDVNDYKIFAMIENLKMLA